MRSARKTPIVGCHFLDQSNRLGRELRLSRVYPAFVLLERAEELTRPSQKCLWLDKEERLSASPNHSGQEHQKKPVCFPADGTFNQSTQDDQLLPQQRVFRQQFGFASGQVGECSERKRCRRWFEPTQNTFLERVQAETDSLLNQEKHILHK
jgi:hypothetical protein